MVVGHAVLQLTELHLLLAQSGEDLEHLVMHRVVATGEGIDRLLTQVADAHTARQRHTAGCRLHQPGKHAQQRRLADAVGPDQPDLAIVGNRRADAQEDIIVAKGDTEIGNC